VSWLSPDAGSPERLEVVREENPAAFEETAGKVFRTAETGFREVEAVWSGEWHVYGVAHDPERGWLPDAFQEVLTERLAWALAGLDPEEPGQGLLPSMERPGPAAKRLLRILRDLERRERGE
jgi:hypothetical protein